MADVDPIENENRSLFAIDCHNHVYYCTMGASSSKGKPFQPRFQLDQDEIRCLETKFKPFMDKHEIIKEEQLENILENVLPKHIVQQLCNHLAEVSKNISSHQQPSSQHYKYSAPITFSSLVATVAELEKADACDLSLLLVKLAGSQRSIVTAKEMCQFLKDVLHSYFKTIKDAGQYQSWKAGVGEMHVKELCITLLRELFCKAKSLEECINSDDIPDVTYTSSDIENWYSHTPIIANIIDRVLKMAFGLSCGMDKVEKQYKVLLPMCCGVDWTKTNSLLNFSDIIFLNHHLPNEQRNQWRYLFSSRHFGDSFSQMIGKIMNKGPTILIIKEKSGCIFGGYASESWKLQPQFHGSSACFLFCLHPYVGIFPSTGFNDHYMYLNINQQTMPNGLGMGGQFNYFAFWLDRDFGQGSCSKTCTTFSCPQLFPMQDFVVDTVEVWGVGPEMKSEEEGTRSALDSVDPELKVMLELVGKGTISDGIREADKKAQEREERVLKAD